MKEISICMDNKYYTGYILFKNTSNNFLAVFAKQIGWTMVCFHESNLTKYDTIGEETIKQSINVSIHNSSLMLKERGMRPEILQNWGFNSPVVINRLKEIANSDLLEFK